MSRGLFIAGSMLGALGVMLGAFGAHGLKARLSEEALAWWQTGVQYHLWHALALLGAAWAAERWPGGASTAAGWAFVGGVVIFSGTLYVMALGGPRWLGAVTPIGGLLLIGGWVLMAVAAMRG